MTERAVFFHRAMAPYEAGDVAGFSQDKAQRIVDLGVADFWPPVATTLPTHEPSSEIDDQLTALDRAALLTFAREHLGLTDAPPPETTDDDLRATIRENIEEAKLLQVLAGGLAGLKSGKARKVT